MIDKDMITCPICHRQHIKDNMSFHHLYPKIDDLDKKENVIYICNTCHDVIHFCHSNYELRNFYNSLDKILLSIKIKEMVELYKYKADNCIFRVKKLKMKLIERCKL